MKRILEMAVPAGAVGLLLLVWSGGAAAQGAEFNLSCNANEALVGIRGRQGWWMDGLAGRCRTVNANGTLGTTVRSTVYRGGTGGTLRTFECNPAEVMVGYSGSQGDNGHVLYVSQVICAPWQANTKTAGTPTRTVTAFGKKFGSGSGQWIAGSCFQGKIGNRLRVRAGQYLDRIYDMGCSYAAGATLPTAPVAPPRPPPPPSPQITAAPSLIGPSGTYNVALCPEPANPKFSWQAAAGAAAYIVEYHNITRARTRTQRVSSTSTRPPARFVEGNEYRWRVRGTNSTGDGPWSPFLNFSGVKGTVSRMQCVTVSTAGYF